MKRLVALAAFHILDHLCAVVDRTPLGCGLINRNIYLGYDADADEFRWTFRNRVTYPLWEWAERNSR